MKKNKLLVKLSIISITSLLIFSNGATADEKGQGESKGQNQSQSQSQEFIASGFRSHGFPVANLNEAPSIGSVQNQQSFVSNDDANSELAWQKWNKQNEVSDRKNIGAAKVLNSAASNPISYHTGGAIGLYTGATQVIPVWVGNWSSSARQNKWNTILGNLVNSLGGSGDIALAGHVLNTNTLYFTSKGAATAKLTWPSSTASAAIPANLATPVNGIVPVSDANVAAYINQAISKNVVQVPPQGVRPIYVYIGANNTRLSSGFGTAYCGWHTYGTLGAKNIPYIAIQDFNSNYASACAAQTVSPNGDYQLDAMASVLVHEIDETITDPDVRTWYDSRGAENADKCAWTFGVTSLVGGAKVNFTAGKINYLIQRNWLADNLVKDTVAGTACVITV